MNNKQEKERGMDITLLRTFVEVAATGSFAAAAERLYVTQSAVSLRIQRLEDELGRPLFKRSKAGAELTPAGAAFERFAFGHLKLWEEAKQQVALPEGFEKSLVIGAEYSLWSRMGFRWIDRLRIEMPKLSIRAEVGPPEQLTRFLTQGIVQSALIYTPQLRPGLLVEKVMEDELILVSANPEAELATLQDQYAFVDWGPEFVHAHAASLPYLIAPGLTFGLGSMTLDFILERNRAAYLPARTVETHIANGRLTLVPDAPRFPYPVFHVWRDDLDEETTAIARNTIHRLAHNTEIRQEKIIDQLGEISEQDEVAVLGETPAAAS